MSRNKVSNLAELQNRSEELKQQGYVAVKPGAFTSPHSDGAKAFSWNDYVHSMLISSANMASANGDAARKQVSTIFASSGNENLAKPKTEGTPNLGFMEWGLGNFLPNIVWLLTRMSPFTSAGHDFIKKILVGHGPMPKYHYTQYVGGNITEKFIPFETAGTLLRGQIADLKAQEAASRQSQSSETGDNGAPVPVALASGNQSDSEEMKSLKQALAKWEETMYGKLIDETHRDPVGCLTSFLEDNDLMETYLNMSGDMALMSQSFCELQLNQRQIEDGTPVPTSRWTPKVIGLKNRSVFTTRLERMDANYRINYAYLSNQWLNLLEGASLKEEDQSITAVPYLPAKTAVNDLNHIVREARQKQVTRKKRPTRFIMSPRDFGGPYYANASWHSIFAGSIFEYAFTIVDDRLTRKRNSNIIGRVIYIHQDYLNALFRQQSESDKKKTMTELQTEVFNDINTWLANPDNAGQALISSVFTGPDGKEHKAWEIVEIETKANSQAQAEKTELQEISSIIFFAMGLDSKLIGNTPGDATSSGGTDLRERFLVKQIQFAPLQQLMLRPLEVISRFNEWDEHLVWQIDREVLTTLDNSKTGVTRQGQE